MPPPVISAITSFDHGERVMISFTSFSDQSEAGFDSQNFAHHAGASEGVSRLKGQSERRVHCISREYTEARCETRQIQHESHWTRLQSDR